jgi:hypothetical protein
LKGKPAAELRTEHQIRQAQYDQWRGQFLAHAASAFEVHQDHQQDAHREGENARLNALVGELLWE